MQKPLPAVPPAIAAMQKRARHLLLVRCRELVEEGVPITRRPRTLTPRTALIELVRLAERWPPKPTTKRKNEPDDPRALVLVEVAREATRILRKDPVLKTAASPVVGLLADVLDRWSAWPPIREPGDVAKLESAATLLKRSYLEDAASCVTKLIADEPHRLFAIEAVCIATISELRSRGWSDNGLRAFFADFEEQAADTSLLKLLRNKERRLRCFVPVSGWEKEGELSRRHPMAITSSLGERMVDPSFPKGPYLTQELLAYDEAEAAERAFLSARGVLDAVALVEPHVAEHWHAPVVGVESGAHIQSHRVGRWQGSVEPLPATVHAIVEHDNLGEACRYRVEAMQLRDPFLRLSLLWLGLQHLVVGSSEYTEPADTLCELVPKAMAIHKVRSEVEALALALEGHLDPSENGLGATLGMRPGDKRIDRERLLARLQRANENDAKQLRSKIASVDLRLAQWLEHLRVHMSGPQSARVAQYFDGTRQRIAWQLLRLRRGHERIGIEDWPLAWVNDLALHAHHYLTVIIIAVMQRRDEGAPRRLPVDVLANRAAQYELFLGLVSEDEKRALEPAVLLDPLALVGT